MGKTKQESFLSFFEVKRFSFVFSRSGFVLGAGRTRVAQTKCTDAPTLLRVIMVWSA
jgi:hypothetical protein